MELYLVEPVNHEAAIDRGLLNGLSHVNFTHFTLACTFLTLLRAPFSTTVIIGIRR